MKSHTLAKMLLDMPDMEVEAEDGEYGNWSVKQVDFSGLNRALLRDHCPETMLNPQTKEEFDSPISRINGILKYYFHE